MTRRTKSLHRLSGVLFALLQFTPLLPLSLTPQLLAESYAWKPLRIGAGGYLTGMDIANDGTKVVRTDTYGAYVWTGAEWKQLVTATSMPSDEVGVDNSAGVYEIRIAPGHTRLLYMMYKGSIYRSDDRGTTWTKTAFARVSGVDANDDYRTHGEKMAVDPADSNVVYAGTSDNGLWHTTNGGAEWEQVSMVPAGTSGQGGITGIAFDPSSGTSGGRTNIIFACSWGNGVYQSTDAGASWHRTSGGPTTVHHGILSANRIYYATDGATAWKYHDTTWVSMNAESDWHTLALDPANVNRMVLGNSGGYLNQSTDGGVTWQGMIWGTGAHPNTRVATDVPWLAWTNESYMSSGNMMFDPTATRKLYFSEGIGAWYLDNFSPTQPWNQGVTWQSQNLGIEQLVANQVIVPPGGIPLVVSWDRPVFHVSDPDSFPTTHGPDREHAIIAGWSIDYSANEPTYVAAVMNFWGTEKSGFSTDGGLTWSAFGTYPVVSTGGCVAVSDPGNIVWAPENNDVPYYTTNNGAIWTQAPFPGAPTSGETVWGWAYYFDRQILAADRVRAGSFYAYNYLMGLYSSTNGGVSWSLTRSGELQPFSGYHAKLRSVPGREGHLFFTVGQLGSEGDANPSDAPLMRSTDGGSTWASLAQVKEVYDVGFGRSEYPGGYPAVYIAGWVNTEWGIWRSTDTCQSWTKIGEFPTGSLDMIKTVAGDPNIFGRVYVGFAGSGYAYGEIAVPTGASTAAGVTPGTFELMQNWPNPCNPSTCISYTIAGSKEPGERGTGGRGPARPNDGRSGGEWVRLGVYDLLGREVAVLVSGYQTPGQHTVVFDGSQLASGVYFYRLTAGGRALARRLVLIK